MTTSRKFLLTVITMIVATVIVVGACGIAATHADTTQGTDPCRDDGGGTVIVGMQCDPNTPTKAQICANGWAHATIGDVDYCPQPKVVIVGESQLGTMYVPRIFPGTRLDVAMRRTSVQSMRYRCLNRHGGSRLVVSHGFYVCRGVSAR